MGGGTGKKYLSQCRRAGEGGKKLENRNQILFVVDLMTKLSIICDRGYGLFKDY